MTKIVHFNFEGKGFETKDIKLTNLFILIVL